MLKILISGALGKMGKKVFETASNTDGVTAVCGVDRFNDLSNPNFPVYDSFDKVIEDVDIVIDFSIASNLNAVLNFAKAKKCGAVLCTTGYSESDVKIISENSKTVPLFRSANMSLGVNILLELVKKASKSLEGFDAEIIEMHHNEKKDAPSGTALLLADGIKEVLPEKFYVYGRNGMVGKRNKDEIGIHAIRGGTIVGEHQVIFAGNCETVTLSHSASDRKVFAEGAVKAAIYLSTKKNGLYNMSNLISGD